MGTTDLGARAIDLAAELVAIDSVNPGLAAAGGGERAVAAALGARLSAAGFTVESVGADPDRPSLIATRTGSAPGPSVVLNGHLDTVPVDGMPAPFTPRIAGDRLLGRGASDMKAGVAGLVVAAEELAARDLPGRLLVVLVADEEDGSTGAVEVLDRLRRDGPLPDVCLIAEPTWLDLAVAHRGYQVLQVDIAGRAAHSSQPDEGVDVVPVVTAVLQGVAEQDGRLRQVAADPELDRGSLMTTVVRAGSAPFTVAASAEIVVERRTLPGEQSDAGTEEVRAVVAGLHPPEGAAVSVRPLIHRSAWRLQDGGAGDELGARLAEALVAAGRPAPIRRGFPYWMECALWEEAGVPALVCGPAGGGLHAVDEWVDLEQVRVYPRAVVEAVTAFAERSSAPVISGG